MINNLLIPLYNCINFDVIKEAPKKRVAKDLVGIFNKELSTLGYSLDKKNLFNLRLLSDKNFSNIRHNILNDLLKISGQEKQYNVLFNNFPYDTPNHYQYLEKRIFNYIRNNSDEDLKINSNNILSCGHVIDNQEFDLSSFGACPICQQQVDELETVNIAKYPYKNVTSLKVLGFLNDNDLQLKAEAIIGRNASINELEQKLLTSLISNPEIRINKPTNKLYKENLPFLYKINSDLVSDQISGATDILRIAAYISNEKLNITNDLSLSSGSLKFNISTSHKRKILTLLDKLPNLEEDMLRHREIWLRLGERINPGSRENKIKYPNVFKAFDKLRNNAKLIETFNRYSSNLMKAIDQNKTDDKDMVKLILLLSSRPGEFIRKLDYMLRKSKDDETCNIIYTNLETVLENIETKVIFETIKYFEYRQSVHEKRIFYPKGESNKIKILDETRAIIDPNALKGVIFFLKEELAKRLEQEPSMGSCYIDESLKDILVPFNQRGDSETTSNIVKGSKYQLNEKLEFVRLFIYWINGNNGFERTDIDLSVNCYDKYLNLLSSVSFLNTKDLGIIHSGDIQNAPKGASEFIDVDIKLLRKNNIHYIVPNIISYTGQSFKDIECFAGYMERDALKSGLHFEPQSVKLKFDLNSQNTNHLPFAFDIKDNKFIYIDMPSSKVRYGNTISNNEKFTEMLKSTIDLSSRKPTVYDVLFENIRSRGVLATNPEEADTVYNIDNLDMENILKLMNPQNYKNNTNSFKLK